MRLWINVPLWLLVLLAPVWLAAWLIQLVIMGAMWAIDRWDDRREQRPLREPALPRLIR